MKRKCADLNSQDNYGDFDLKRDERRKLLNGNFEYHLAAIT